MKLCKECQREFEPKNAKAIFCSDACRQKDYRKSTEKWVKEVQEFCNQEGITHEDLILAYRERNKPKKAQKDTTVHSVKETPPEDKKQGTAMPSGLSKSEIFKWLKNNS